MDKPNFLFIMADQLRADYLGCTGHPTLQTPHIDALAADGINCANAHVQGPVCGSSRMSFYTGRYVMNHGATYNNVPLRAGEPTLGDHLRPLGYRVALVGKTHFKPDMVGLKRLGVNLDSAEGIWARQCGFEPYARDDGLHPDSTVAADLAYNVWLRELGYEGHNPWHCYANSAIDANGEVVSGWYLRNAHLPARVSEEHSETAYATDRAMAFIDESANGAWCLHLSYIKPHWPYMAPAPYHQMYGREDVIPANKSASEKERENPVVAAFRQHEESVIFSRDETRERVIPTYMGLVSQLDHHVGRLFEHLRARGLWDRTVIVFTSDHGDYLGDHWLGEKEMFHEESLRIPLIIRDPSPSADATRGKTEDCLVESIDLIPTMMERAGATEWDHVLEGRSLVSLIGGNATANWRGAVFSEADYAWRPARNILSVAPDAAQARMVRTREWKLIRYRGFGCELFDLVNDPSEHHNRAGDPACKPVLNDLMGLYIDWLETRRTRTTITNNQVAAVTDTARQRGYIFGAW